MHLVSSLFRYFLLILNHASARSNDFYSCIAAFFFSNASFAKHEILLPFSNACADTSPFDVVPVDALANDEYPIDKSAIAQIGKIFFLISFSPCILFKYQLGGIYRLNKLYKYKMQIRYISLKIQLV